MKIRSKITLRFSLIVAAILLVFSLCIYYSASIYRTNDFHRRLMNRGLTAARLYADVEEVDKELLRIIDKNTINAIVDERISIYDRNGKLKYHSEEAGSPLFIDASAIDAVKRKGRMEFLIDHQEAVGFEFRGDNKSYIVFCAADDDFGVQQIRNLGIILMIGFGASIIVTALSGWFFSRKLLVPISNVIKEVDLISGSSLDKRVSEGNKQDEIAQLAITFNKMLDRLQEAFEAQRRFVSSASHELRTPLTSISGEIEVALMKSRSDQEYRNTLVSVQDEIRKLTILTNGLLKLAQSSNDKQEIRVNAVRVDELLWDIKDELAKVNPDYNVQINFASEPEEDGDFTLMGNETLLKTAVLNIIDNACKFSEDRKVQVTIAHEGGLKLNFSDNGIGIPKSEIKNLLRPFYRAGNAAGIHGHGLGLCLADRIFKLHLGTLSINSIEGKGTNVSVDFRKEV